MNTIREILHGRDTFSANAHDSVLHTARYMVEHNIGAVPVLNEGQLEGIFSERDIMKRVLVEGLDPASTRVAEVMTRNPLVVSPDDKIEHCLVLMKQHGFRHLPVCNGRKLEGFLSLRDLLLHEVNEKDGEVRLMREYMHAIPGQG
ncbi:MAG TPA: CBS domain-containing protein [Terriglobales bacterium]|nr:CBS domain-containing protein [Terriglobales bacterium]